MIGLIMNTGPDATDQPDRSRFNQEWQGFLASQDTDI
jgi:hypothetical protein